MTDNSKTSELTETIIRVFNSRKPQTTEELIALTNENKIWPEEEILDAISDLQAEGKVRLIKPNLTSPSSFSSYLKCKEAIWFWASLAIAVLTLFSSFLISSDLYPWSYLRNFLGLIFIMWLPGYVFIRMLLPVHEPFRDSSSTLGNLERIALSIIVSLAFVSIIGLILNYTPWGINLTTIVISLFILSLVFVVFALVREYNYTKV